MTEINWDVLVTIKDWAAALQRILDDAKAAVTANDQGAKLDAQDLLRTFTKRSPVECEFLDNIALKAINDLFISVSGSALEAISSRNAELQQATKLIKDVGTQAQKDAKAIQFEKVISALDKAKSAAEALKNLETSLAQPDQNLLGKIKALSGAIEDIVKLA
jgi:hypothetical protein